MTQIRDASATGPAPVAELAQEAHGVATGRLASGDVRSMFDRIAPVYDAMNRLMTLGLDQRWRQLTAEAVVGPNDRVLDACCGTGDLAVAAERAGGRVVGLDFSEPARLVVTCGASRGRRPPSGASPLAAAALVHVPRGGVEAGSIHH